MKLIWVFSIFFLFSDNHDKIIDPGLYKGSLSGSHNQYVQVVLSLNFDGTYNYKKTLPRGKSQIYNGDWKVIDDTLKLVPTYFKAKGYSEKAKHDCPPANENFAENCEEHYLYIYKKRIFLSKISEEYRNPLNRAEKYELED